MRTKMFFIWTLATAFLTNSLTAKPIDVANIKVTAVKKSLNVNVAKTLEEIVEVTIENTEGVTLYADRIEKNVTRKRYDLRNLPLGQYRLSILKNRVKTIQPFIINVEDITISEADRTLKLLPKVVMKGSKMMEVKVFSSENDNVTLKIVDNQGITAYQQTIEAKAFAKRYDLSKLPSGVYFVEIDAGNEPEYFTIQL